MSPLSRCNLNSALNGRSATQLDLATRRSILEFKYASALSAKSNRSGRNDPSGQQKLSTPSRQACTLHICLYCGLIEWGSSTTQVLLINRQVGRYHLTRFCALVKGLYSEEAKHGKYLQAARRVERGRAWERRPARDIHRCAASYYEKGRRRRL